MKNPALKLSKTEIAEKMAKMLIAAPSPPVEKLVADWSNWRKVEKWISENPEVKNKRAWFDDQGDGATIIEEHRETYDEIKDRTWGLLESALLKSDPSIFREIAAAISKQNRLAKKRKRGVKEFNYKDFLLLKDALSSHPNVTRLAKYLIRSGWTQRSQTLNNVISDLRRRRKELKLPQISSKG